MIEVSALKAIHPPAFRFSKKNTLLFINGVAISGKSTISPLIASTISDCALQQMDIMRLAAQEIEEQKDTIDRNPFVFLGSCDSYTAINDGEFSTASLIEGFNLYALAVFKLVENILPKLEIQGAQNVLFEGVQLTPSLVKPHLSNNNKLIVVITTEEQIDLNRRKLFANNAELLERYSIPILMSIQEEILTQAQDIDDESKLIVSNARNFVETTKEIVTWLAEGEVIVTSNSF